MLAMIHQLKTLGFSHNHHRRHHHHRSHHMPEADLASLQAFRSLVSQHLNQVLESLKLESEFLSLTWIHECFKILPMITSAFAKLMVEIDYPVSRWEAGSIDEFLGFTINLLDLLNMIGSSISHVNQAQVSLSHALSLMQSSPALAIERMKEMKKQDSIKEFKVMSNKVDTERNMNGKEWIFHEAMMIFKSCGIWVCGVVLMGFKIEVIPIMNHGVFVDSSLMALDSLFRKRFMEEGGIVKEIEEVNESVRLIVANGNGDSDSDGGMELKRRLEVVGNGLKGLKEEEECVFRSVMAARNQVLETLRKDL